MTVDIPPALETSPRPDDVDAVFTIHRHATGPVVAYEREVIGLIGTPPQTELPFERVGHEGSNEFFVLSSLTLTGPPYVSPESGTYAG